MKDGSVVSIVRVLTKRGGDNEKTVSVSSEIRRGFFRRPAPLVQGNSGPAHFSVWFSLVVRISQ